MKTLHDRHVDALLECSFVRVSRERNFNKHSEVFVRKINEVTVIWAYDDYGILWRCRFHTLGECELILLSDLFTIYAHALIG